MTARRHDLIGLPDWPRLLSAEQAAAYLGVTAPTFAAKCPVKPCRLFGSRTLYDRKALDRWVDATAPEGKPTGFGDLVEGAHAGDDNARQGH